MKKVYSLIVLAMFIAPMLCQHAVAQGDGLFPFFDDNDRFGYIDRTGKWMIEPQFDDAGVFAEGLAAVLVNDKWGYIDRSGKVVIKPQFNVASLFSEGLAVVLVNDQWGYIDRDGKMVIKPQFSVVDDFSEGLAAVSVSENDGADKTGFIDKYGKWVLRLDDGCLTSFSDGVATVCSGYINKKGMKVLEWVAPHGAFKEGVAVVYSDDGYGYIDKDGHWAIATRFQNVNDFSEGLAAVEQDDKWGYIDRSGSWVILPQFDYSDFYGMNFYGGLAWVAKDGKMGYINKNGEWVINRKTEERLLIITLGEAVQIKRYQNVIEIEEVEETVMVDTIYDEETGEYSVYDKETGMYIDKNGNMFSPPVGYEVVDDVRVEEVEEDDAEDVVIIPDENAEFPGGEDALHDFIEKNLRFPDAARDNVSGKVYAKFVVEKDGSISNIQIIRNIGYGCGEEVVRLVESMPKWIPAKVRGYVVRSQFILPINFVQK